MTLQEYMNENFTVIDATSQAMSLQEAIEEVKRQGLFEPEEIEGYGRNLYQSEVIATIINAVVKGELK